MASWEDQFNAEMQKVRDQSYLKHVAQNPTYYENPITLQVNNQKAHSNSGYVPQATKRDVLPANPWTVDEASAKSKSYNGLQYMHDQARDYLNQKLLMDYSLPNQPYGDWLKNMGLKSAIQRPLPNADRGNTFDQLENQNPWNFTYKDPKFGTHIGSTNQPQWTGSKPLSNPLSFLDTLPNHLGPTEEMSWSGPTASTPITDSIINRIKMLMMGG